MINGVDQLKKIATLVFFAEMIVINFPYKRCRHSWMISCSTDPVNMMHVVMRTNLWFICFIFRLPVCITTYC